MRILVLAPHTDDAEISCGGTISRMIRESNDVYVTAFSASKKSLLEGFDDDVTRREFHESMKYIGIENYTLFDYPTRHFPEHRQEILDDIIHIGNMFCPDIVFLHNSYDIHQDHQVIYQEGIRVFRNRTIYGYENPWNNMGKSNISTYIRLNIDDVKNKMNMMIY